METGAELIAKERAEQIEKHGRSIADDVKNNRNGELVIAASSLLFNDARNRFGPSGWDGAIWEAMSVKPRKERLIIAGALIAAEIDRINATAAKGE